MPIFGNGDVFSPLDAARMGYKTGCDGFMIARAAIKNPWVFKDFARMGSRQSQGRNDEPDPEGTRPEVTNAVTNQESWPTVDQVNEAMDNYSTTATEWKTKEKFVNFHLENFKRLHRVALTGNKTLKVLTPNTMHLT